MHNPIRRKILGWMVTLPFASKVAVRGSVQKSEKPPDDEIAPAAVAVSAVRLFNTAEHWHKLKLNKHATMPELLEFAFPHDVLELKDRTSGRRFQMNVKSKDVLSGWRVLLHASENRDDYLVVMKSDDVIIASGDRGVIYFGSAPPEPELPQSYVPITELLPLGLQPLTPAGISQNTARSRAASVIRRVAFVNVGGSVARDGCTCTCSQSSQTACWNLGFESCPWCCCSSQSSCCLDAAVSGGMCQGCRCVGCGCPPC